MRIENKRKEDLLKETAETVVKKTTSKEELTEKKSSKKISAEEMLTKSYMVPLCAVFCCLLWGSAYPAIKWGYLYFRIAGSDTAGQILFAGMRFTLAGIFTVILGSMVSHKVLLPKKETLGKIAFISLFQTIIQYVFFYCGLARASAVKASIINGSSTFFAILFSVFIFRTEKWNMKKLVGCLLGFIGVILVNISPGSMDMNMKLTGEGFLLLATLAYAMSSCLIKKYSAGENPMLLSGYQFILGGVVMMLLSLCMGGRITHSCTEGIVILIYLAGVSAVAYSLWAVLLKYNSVSKVTVYSFTIPIFGAVLSALCLSESLKDLGGICILALILVCAGIYVVNRKEK